MVWKSLSAKLIIAFLLVTAAAVAAVSLIQAGQVGSDLIDNGGRLLQARAEAEARLVGNILDSQIARLRSIAIDAPLRTAAAERYAAYPADEAEAARQIDAEDARWPTASPDDPLIAGVLDSPLATDLRAQAQLDQNIAELMFTDRRGALVAASARSSDYNQADEEWWQRAAAGELFISPPDFDSSSGSFSIIIALAVYDQGGTALVGVLRSTYRTDAITLRLAEDRFGASTQALLLVGDQILRPGGSQLSTPSPANARSIAQARDANYVLADYQGLPRLLALAPVRSTREVAGLTWEVLLYQNRSEALAPVIDAQRSTLITALIVLAVAAVVATISAELFAGPIRQITGAAERITAGDLSERVGRYTNDEIGRLARGFDQMAASLQERIDAEQAAQAERLRIQQAMIEAQERRIDDLTTPTIPLGHGILLLPLIGSIDQQRAERVLSTLLADVHARRAHTLILDLSGVREPDTQVMAVLMRAAEGARLLGARIILVGLRAQAARALVDLDIGVADIHVYASLQDALDDIALHAQ